MLQAYFSWASFISKENVFFLEGSFLDTRVVRSEDWSSKGTWKKAASQLPRLALLLVEGAIAMVEGPSLRSEEPQAAEEPQV